jgi:hypothetical protein
MGRLFQGRSSPTVITPLTASSNIRTLNKENALRHLLRPRIKRRLTRKDFRITHSSTTSMVRDLALKCVLCCCGGATRLLIVFLDSLDRSTTSIAAKLTSTLQDSHQIRISRFAAATAQSQSYIDHAREIAGNLGATPILSEESDKQMQVFNDFVDQKKSNISALWNAWKSITKEIIDIRNQVIAINPLRNTDQKGGDDEDGDEDDKEFIEEAFTKIRGVGRKWTGRMEESERVRPFTLPERTPN